MDRKRYQRERKVVVKNGVDIKGQAVGSDKGSYFTGQLKEQDTYIMKKKTESFWWISFRNVKTGELHQVRFQSRLLIGRMLSDDEESVLEITGDPMISKNHCSIFEAENQLLVEDLNSKNGTFINNKRVLKTEFLHNGDTLQIGNTRYIVGYARG